MKSAADDVGRAHEIELGAELPEALLRKIPKGVEGRAGDENEAIYQPAKGSRMCL